MKMDEHNLRDALESCRPGSEDVQFPEMAELAQQIAQDETIRQRYEQMQRLDAALGAAFQDVPVPAGLADRVRSRLAAAPEPSRVTAEAPAQPPAPHPDGDSLVASARQADGRWKWVLGGMGSLITAAAVLLALLWVGSPNAEPISGEELALEAQRWWQAALDEEEHWQTELASAPLSRYPLDASLQGTPWRWHRVASPYDRSAVMYDMTPPGKPRALLFVARTTVRFAMPEAPLAFLPTSGGYSSGAWHRNDLLYVLVVEGERQRLQQLIKTPVLGFHPADRSQRLASAPDSPPAQAQSCRARDWARRASHARLTATL